MDVQNAINEFHRHFYESGYAGGTWRNTYWMGAQVEKNPLDLWVYQELLYSLKPDLIVEIGTMYGGSAFYFASLCQLWDRGRVVTVDIEAKKGRPQHDRITYITGNSIEATTLEKVKKNVVPGETTMVILDSNHFKDHVLAEMRLYHSIVSVGSYLVVEDGNINGNPVNKGHGPGPTEAIKEFLMENKKFVPMKEWEKYFMTFNPGGYLKRIQ